VINIMLLPYAKCWRISGALLALFCSSCSYSDGRAQFRSQDQWNFLSENLYIEAKSDCGLILSSRTIEQAERLSFERRASQGIIAEPINIECLKKNFKSDEILRQARDGDPVARVIAIDIVYKNKNEFCKNLDKVLYILDDVYKVKVEVNGKDVSRVTESYYLKGAAMFECGVPGWEEIYSLSPSRGFDPAARHSPVVD